MILLSKLSMRLSFNKPIPICHLKSQFIPKSRHINSESNDPAITKIRNLKRYFAFALFGVTLIAAITVKQRKKRQWTDLLSKTSRSCQFGDLVLYEYEHYMLPKPVLELLDKIQNLELRENDVILTSFPKTGTTWLSEIVWLLTNNLDYETARKVGIGDRFPYLEWPTPGIKSIADSHKNPRLIKTHLPVSILLKNRKVKPRLISITRDPKDVVVSYYHFSRMNTVINFDRGFPEFLDLFLQDKVAYGPIYRFYHELEKINLETNNEVFVTKFEDLKNNFESVVGKLCTFLGREPLNEKEMKRLKEHCSFEEMRFNPSVNYEHWDDLGVRKKGESKFMRKGVVGDWKTYFTPEQKENFDEWFILKTNATKPVDEIDVKLNLV